MKRMLQSFTPDRLILGLAALLLSAYALIGNHVWGEVQSTQSLARGNEKAVVSISKDVEQMNASLKGLDQKITQFMEQASHQEESERLDRIIRMLERTVRRGADSSTPSPPQEP